MREEIRVRRRREPVVEEVAVTRHGPVVVPPEPGGREGFALRWSHHEPGETLRSLLDLMDARSVAEADRALDRFAGPPHSFVLADADGAIGYRLAGGPIPLRTGDGRDPVPGWDSSHEWSGYLAQDELPHARDPKSGLVVSANNRIDARVDIPGEYLSGYRAARLEALIRERERLTAADCERIMLDTLCAPGLELAGLVAGLETEDPLEQRALDLLRDWDGDLGVDSRAGAVYGALLEALERACYADAADPDVPISLVERSRPALLRALAEREDGFLPEGRSWAELLPAALTEAVRALGPDPERWRRGERHRLELRHALDGVRGLAAPALARPASGRRRRGHDPCLRPREGGRSRRDDRRLDAGRLRPGRPGRDPDRHLSRPVGPPREPALRRPARRAGSRASTSPSRPRGRTWTSWPSPGSSSRRNSPEPVPVRW